MVVSNYAPDKEEDEQDDDNDADMVMHMQMKLNVDVPVDTQTAEKSPKAPEAALAGIVAKAPSPQQVSLLQMPEVAAVAGNHPSTQADVGTAPRQKEADPASSAFFSGNQIFLAAGAGAALVIVGAMLATGVKACLSARKGHSEHELKLAAKAWMLDWALGYEPEDEKDDEIIQTEMKMPMKKQPPRATASDDSCDTDEEEPEAESDGGEMLEDAVFVAEQVEVANRSSNEAYDAGYCKRMYGIDQEAKAGLVDQIQVDLR